MPKVSSWFQSIQVGTILNSRIILYLLLFISIIHLLMFVMSGNLVFCILFFLVGFLTTFFSKNMIVVMFIALVVTGLLKSALYPKEGFESIDSFEDTFEDSFEDTFEDSFENKTPDSSPSPSPISMNATSSPSSIPSSSPSSSPAAMTKKMRDDFTKMAKIQVKMLESINELRPVLNQSKNTLEQIKKIARNSSSPSPSPA